MDLQLTNVEHFSESDIEEKMQQLAVCIHFSFVAHDLDTFFVFYTVHCFYKSSKPKKEHCTYYKKLCALGEGVTSILYCETY